MSEVLIAENKAPVGIKAIFGQKVGMTQIFDARGEAIPVTVVKAGPCSVSRVFTKEKHGYSGIQVGFGDVKVKNLNHPDRGQFVKVGISPLRWLREIRLYSPVAIEVGQVIDASVFSSGDYVDVVGFSKGRGFAGAMKRHNFGGGPSTHGQSDRARATGSSGSNTYPGRVFKGKKFPGRFGNERITVQHLEIVKVIPEKNLLLIRGAVPGVINGVLEIRQTVKKLKVKPVHPDHDSKKEKKKDAKAAAPAAKAKGGK